MSHSAVQTVSTVILAGARQGGDALAEAHGVATKASIKVAGRSLLGRVLDAVSAALPGGKIVVSGFSGEADLVTQEGWPAVEHVAGEAGPAASVANVISTGELSYPILVTTCDHALLSAQMVTEFVDASMAMEADLTVALARRDTIEQAYPDVARTYLRLGGEEYSACNLFMIRKPDGLKVVSFWTAAEADRKRPWRIAWRFGLVAALRILVGRAPLEKTMAIASQRLGVQARAVILPFADAAVDVDKPSDLDLVTRVLEARSR